MPRTAKPPLLPGELISLPLGKTLRPLDGFIARSGKQRARSLLVFVHGMGSNFYRSAFKKTWMQAVRGTRYDLLSFNNRGAEQDTAHEKFRDCLRDLDAALDGARALRYRAMILIGHSTGCQKIAYYQAVRNRKDVKALLLTAIGDDYEILRRDLGASFTRKVTRARALVADGRPDALVQGIGFPFAAHRFLSIADPDQLEARLFRFDGPMRHVGKVRCPILGIFPEAEEYAVIPVQEAARQLQAKARRANPCDVCLIPGANHGFKGRELEAVRAGMDWIHRIVG